MTNRRLDDQAPSRVGWLVALSWLSIASATSLGAQRGAPGAEFARYPFERWLAEGNAGKMRWSLHVAPVRLSGHQRLLTHVEIRVDGAALAERRGPGRLLLFLQVTDGEGRRYQEHAAVKLEKLEACMAHTNLVYSQSMFVVPGDYRIAVAWFDTHT